MPQKTGKAPFMIIAVAFVLCLTMQTFAQDDDSSVKPKDFKVVPSPKIKNQVDISVDLSHVNRNLRLNDVGVVVFFYGQDGKRLDAKLYKFVALAGGRNHRLSRPHNVTAARSLDGKLYWNGAYALGGAVDVVDSIPSSAGKVPIATADSDSADKETLTKPNEKSNLAAPTLVSPAAGIVFNHDPRKVTLKWKPVPGAASYTVEWDCFHCCEANKWCSDLGKPVEVKSGLTTTSYTFEFGGAQPGRWRVWAVGSDGKASPKSEWREFRFTK